jgi:hypothetical protein
MKWRERAPGRVRVLRVFVCLTVLQIKNDFYYQLGSEIGDGKTAWPLNAERSIRTARIGMVERQTANWQRYSTPV